MQSPAGTSKYPAPLPRPDEARDAPAASAFLPTVVSTRPSRRPRLSSHRLLAAGVIALVGIGAWLAYGWWRGPQISVDIVTRSDLVESVVASGNVETPFRVSISSQITAMVTDVLVAEGARVERGQALVLLEANELKAQHAQAQGALAQAEARMRQLLELTLPTAREALAQARATALQAQQTYDRTVVLFKNGHASQSALDEAQKNLDVARTQVRTAQLQVYTASPGGSDYVMAETQLRQAHANLEAAASRLGYTLIVSPRDGVLISRNVERGMIVQPGTSLLILSPSGPTQLVLDIDEKNLGRLRIGQPALASADAYPSQRFEARVAYINPGIDLSRASVVVKLDVPAPPSYLVQDMTVSVDIEVARHGDALTVPRRDVHELLGAAPWVLVEAKGRAYAQKVRVGLIGDNAVEILDGLAEGDRAIPINAAINAGQRIRTTRS